MTSAGERVENFKQRNLVTVKEATTLVVAAKMMAEKKIGCLVVHREGDTSQPSNMIGLLSETDLVRKGLARGKPLSATKVAQVMATPL